MICVSASVYLKFVLPLKQLATLLAANIKGWSHYFLRVDLLKLRHLVIDDHLIGQQVEIGIFWVCHKGAAEGAEDELFYKDGAVCDYEVAEVGNRDLVAHVD